VHWSLTSLIAVALLGSALAMILIEIARDKTSPPVPNPGPGKVLYWITYLSLIVLGVTVLLAAIVR
jgi:hypothetical protein